MLDAVRRAGEIGMALVALGMAALSGWLCYELLVHPSPSAATGPTLWAALYAIAFLAIALGVFGLRLLVPRWRVGGGRIIGRHGLLAAGLLYGLLLGLALWTRSTQLVQLGLPLALGLALGTAVRSTLGRRPGR